MNSTSSTNLIEQFIANQGFLVLDGALATEMEKLGADLNDPLWSAKLLLEDSPLIHDVAYQYLLAGADIVTTNTYQATVPGFVKKGINKTDALDLIKKAAEIGLKTRDDFWKLPTNRYGRIKPLVCGSIGPYGAYLADGSEYSGSYSLSYQEFCDFHRPRMEILFSTGVDLFMFETFPALDEIKSVLKMMEEFSNQYGIISFNANEQLCLPDGTPIAEAVKAADENKQIASIGFNCIAPSLAEKLLMESAKWTNKPLMIYPNSGEKWDAIHNCWIEGSEEDRIGSFTQKWYEAGARLIGGCCRTSPDDIKEVRSFLSKHVS